MVFNNEDYLKAFPRTEKPVAAPAAAPVSTKAPGDALEPEPEVLGNKNLLSPEEIEIPARDNADDLYTPVKEEEGGAADGDE